MSRREEVEASIKWIMSAGMSGGAITPNMRDLARTLADEVDIITAERDEWKRRLDAVVAIVGLEQQGEFEDWPAGEHLHALRDVRAIAEGRDNG